MKVVRYLLLIVVILISIGQSQLKAVVVQDSLRLLQLRNELHTPFHPWVNEWNLNDPVNTWHGVVVAFFPTGVHGPGEYVVELNLNNNKLSGEISQGIVQLSRLNIANFSNNYISKIDDLSISGTWNPNIDIRGNILKFNQPFESLATKAQNAGSQFEFKPQRPFGIGGYKLIRPGGFKLLKEAFPRSLPIFPNTYTWEMSIDTGMTWNVIQTSGVPGYLINNATPADNGFYRVKVTSSDPFLDNFTLITTMKGIRVEFLTDSLGAEIVPNRMMVSYPNSADPADGNSSSRATISGLTEAEKDSIRSEFGAVVVDSCICGSAFTGVGDLELWEIPDSLTFELERIRRTSRQRARVESADYDYYVETDDTGTVTGSPDADDEIALDSSTDVVYVGLVDSGVQWDHASIKGLVQSNSADPTDGTDDDGNCLVDDYNGYDFANDTSYAVDFNGHGTHLAGIILDQTNTKIQIINAKASDSTGSMSLFDAVCGMYYAMERGARVLNLSWGYNGEPTQILERAIFEAGDPFYASSTGYLGHDVLIVTSAGNDGDDNDTIDHYPSNYNYDHMITVGALNGTETALATFSNYGATTVDVAAPGTSILSAYPNNQTLTISGTSQAAAAVSKLAAQLINANPNACARGIKDCILSTAASITDGTSKLVSGGMIDEAAALSCATSATVEVCNPIYQLKVMLEGPFDTSTGLMNDDLRVAGLIPTIQPFANLSVENDDFGFPIPLYNGTETITNATILTTTGNDAIVDWVLVGVIDPSTADTSNIGEFTLVNADEGFYGSRQACLLQKDGDIVDVDGNLVTFTDRNFSGYVFVMSRNHAAVKTAEIINGFTSPIVIDFTNNSVATEGGSTDLLLLDSGIYGLISGDVNFDGQVGTTDQADLINQNGTTPAYENGGDLNLDGEVNAADIILFWNKNNGSSTSCSYCTGEE